MKNYFGMAFFIKLRDGYVQELKLFQPKDTPKFFGGTSNAIGQGQNPKSGVLIDYYIPKEQDSLDLTLEILQDGSVIRNFSSNKPEGFKSWSGGPPAPQILPSGYGYHRFAWGFDRNALPPVDDVFVFGNLCLCLCVYVCLSVSLCLVKRHKKGK